MVTLVGRLERLRGAVLNPGIQVTLQTWLDTVMKVQDRRREEIVNNRDKDVLALAEAIASLAAATRSARTGLWSALLATVLREVDTELAMGRAEPKVGSTQYIVIAVEIERGLYIFF